MTFDEFLKQAWTDHATDAVAVATRLNDGLQLVSAGEQIPQMASLVTHVLGEHLGRWDDAVGTLKRLRGVRSFETGSEAEKSIARSIASMEVAAGQRESLDELSTSDQIRVLAVAASALSSQKRTDEARLSFSRAIELAQSGLAKEDPANRALAVTGNILACELEEKPTRSKSETELMILAAQTGRKFWEIAGTWVQIERAEYRLSQSYLKAGDLIRALKHAQLVLEISTANDLPALEFFFGYEALALVETARANPIGFKTAADQMRIQFELLNDDDKKWCKASLEKLGIPH
ncbi:MAG: hypothetical protein AAB250_04685 [Bdellovibrionota bacterium]